MKRSKRNNPNLSEVNRVQKFSLRKLSVGVVSVAVAGAILTSGYDVQAAEVQVDSSSSQVQSDEANVVEEAELVPYAGEDTVAGQAGDVANLLDLKSYVVTSDIDAFPSLSAEEKANHVGSIDEMYGGYNVMFEFGIGDIQPGDYYELSDQLGYDAINNQTGEDYLHTNYSGAFNDNINQVSEVLIKLLATVEGVEEEHIIGHSKGNRFQFNENVNNVKNLDNLKAYTSFGIGSSEPIINKEDGEEYVRLTLKGQLNDTAFAIPVDQITEAVIVPEHEDRAWGRVTQPMRGSEANEIQFYVNPDGTLKDNGQKTDISFKIPAGFDVRPRGAGEHSLLYSTDGNKAKENQAYQFFYEQVGSPLYGRTETTVSNESVASATYTQLLEKNENTHTESTEFPGVYLIDSQAISNWSTGELRTPFVVNYTDEEGNIVNTYEVTHLQIRIPRNTAGGEGEFELIHFEREVIEVIPYETERKENPDLAPGEERVIQKGVPGRNVKVFQTIFNPNTGEYVGEETELTDKRYTEAPINEIIEYGPEQRDETPGDEDTPPGDKETPGDEGTPPGGGDTPGGDDTLGGGDDTLGGDDTPGGDDTLGGDDTPGGNDTPGGGDTPGGDDTPGGGDTPDSGDGGSGDDDVTDDVETDDSGDDISGGTVTPDKDDSKVKGKSSGDDSSSKADDDKDDKERKAVKGADKSTDSLPKTGSAASLAAVSAVTILSGLGLGLGLVLDPKKKRK